MNSQHLVDHAIFDTCYAKETVAHERRSEIDDFIKRSLLNLIDEVFNEFTTKESVIRIDNLSIDLGDIPYHDYQYQMPKRLREQLVLALDDVRQRARNKELSKHETGDEKTAAQAQLFFFLRHGYLPWYSRLSSGDALEQLLTDTIATTPDRFVDFMRHSGQQKLVIDRLTKQFSPQLLQQVTRLLASARADLPQQVIDDLRSQLVAALLSQGASSIEPLWQALIVEDAPLLEQTLRQYGQQARVRHHIVASFSNDMFNNLLRLLEPGEQGFVQAVIKNPNLFQAKSDHAASNRKRRESELCEFSLAYLLVERGSRFDKKSYLASLLRQMALSSNQSESSLLQRLLVNINQPGIPSKPVSEMSQMLSEIAGQSSNAKQLPLNQYEAYAQYERVKSVLTTVDSEVRYIDAKLLADIKSLARTSPWLLMRLYRELQTGIYDWELAIQGLSASLLSELSHALLSLNHQPASELIAAIRTNAQQSSGQKYFFKHILTCLLKGELIDFDTIDSVALDKIDEVIESRPSCKSQKPVDLKPPAIGQAKNIIMAQLEGAAELSEQALLSLEQSIELIGRQQQALLRQLFEPVLNDSRLIPSLVERLPERIHIKLLSYLGINNYDSMMQCAELLDTASYLVLKTAQPLEAHKWRFIYTYIAGSRYLFNERYFVREYVESLIQQVETNNAREFRASLGQGLLQNSLPSTRDITQRLISLLADQTDTLSGLATDTCNLAESGEQRSVEQKDESEVLEEIYIDNAGVVLLAPYLPRLFERLDLIGESGFKHRDAAERAVHCLQFLVNESLSSPEYQLVLNKLICGVKPGLPIRRSIELTAEEKTQLEVLLEAVTQHWKALNNTSINGLRESFLQRAGRLQLKDDAWHLSIEERSFDMLLDQLPWSYSTIKFSWMDRIIFVEWR